MGTGWQGYLLERRIRPMISCDVCHSVLPSGALSCAVCAKRSSEFRASRIKELDTEGFERLAHERLNWLDAKLSIPDALRTALAVEGEAFAREFHAWTSAPPDPAARLARVGVFSTWCSKVSAAVK